MEDTLKGQIKVVAVARKLAQEKADAWKSARTAWEEANKNLLEEAMQTSQFAQAAETVLRELTLQAYAQTGNKSPAEGVGIREVTKLEYDNGTAFRWAIEHSMALKLDTNSFEKIAKASPLDFVKITLQPQATIATDLDKILSKEKK